MRKRKEFNGVMMTFHSRCMQLAMAYYTSSGYQRPFFRKVGGIYIVWSPRIFINMGRAKWDGERSRRGTLQKNVCLKVDIIIIRGPSRIHFSSSMQKMETL